MAVVIPSVSTYGAGLSVPQVEGTATHDTQEYQPVEIVNLQPKEILPIVGQVEAGDKKVYNHIEHLRLAESTRIREMMRKYGAGNHSPEEYQQLMNRLNTGMILETPK